MLLRYLLSGEGTPIGPGSSRSGPYWPVSEGSAAAGASSGRVALAKTSPCPGSLTPQPNTPSVNRATAIALATGFSASPAALVPEIVVTGPNRDSSRSVAFGTFEKPVR